VIRAQIVDAAVVLMAENGVARTNVDEVRAVAGVSGSQMSHYFHDKKSLIRAVIERQVRSVLADHDRPELGQLDTFEALYRWGDMLIERLHRHECRGGCTFGSLAGELVTADRDILGDLASGFDQWLALLSHGLAAMRSRGDLVAAANPDELALSLLSTLQGGALIAQVRRDTQPVRVSLNAMLARVRSFAADPAIRASEVELANPAE
jgi:AcrR family transcriptional regulator